MASYFSEKIFVHGPAGKLETVAGVPENKQPRGVAVVAHPHPLYGGTMHNKVVHTLFKSFLELGFISAKFNFRGVGESEGPIYSPKAGSLGETEDLLAVTEAVKKRFAARLEADPLLLLAGFSFGGAIVAFAAQRLRTRMLVMVAPAVHGLNVPVVAWARGARENGETGRVLVIHGDHDEVVPLEMVLAWAAPQELPVVVVPGAEHFFHGRLHILKQIVLAFFRT